MVTEQLTGEKKLPSLEGTLNLERGCAKKCHPCTCKTPKDDLPDPLQELIQKTATKYNISEETARYRIAGIMFRDIAGSLSIGEKAELAMWVYE
jgi:hypothetical protein